MAVLLVLTYVLVWSIPRAHAEERMRVALDIRNSIVTSPKVLAAALREAAGIWSPYGVTIEKLTRRSPAGDRLTVVPVTFESARSRGHIATRSAPLGWTGFSGREQPVPRMSLFYDVIAAAANDTGLFGPREIHAAVLQERLLARVLGRTIAHEIGHIVLRRPDHAPTGLMRAAQPVTDLQHPSTESFLLDEASLARLREVFNSRTAVATQQ